MKLSLKLQWGPLPLTLPMSRAHPINEAAQASFQDDEQSPSWPLIVLGNKIPFEAVRTKEA